MTDRIPDEDDLDVPAPEPERVKELVEADQRGHICDPPALRPGDEWVCEECGRHWEADRQGVSAIRE